MEKTIHLFDDLYCVAKEDYCQIYSIEPEWENEILTLSIDELPLFIERLIVAYKDLKKGF